MLVLSAFKYPEIFDINRNVDLQALYYFCRQKTTVAQILWVEASLSNSQFSDLCFGNLSVLNGLKFDWFMIHF